MSGGPADHDDPFRGQRSTRHALPHVTKHARDRMIEYFGRDLEPGEWEVVIAAVQRGQAACMSLAERDGYGIYAVSVGGFAPRFSWRFETQMVVTVLPPEGGNHRGVARYSKRKTRRKGDQQKAHWRDGQRYPARIRWDGNTDTGRGPREAQIDTAEDEP